MPPVSKNFLLGNGCMLLAVIFWGVNVPVTKALIPDWMTADTVSAVRLVGGCLLFWLTSIFVKCESIDRNDWLKIAPGGLVGLFAFIYLFILSLRYGSVIDISIIMTMPPMFVILMTVIFQHNRPSMLEYCGIVISFIGAVLVIMGGGHASSNASQPLLGDLLAMLSAMCYAFYLFILEKPSKKYKPLTLLRWVYLFAALPGSLLLENIGSQPIWHDAPLAPWLEILFILFCPTFLAYFLVQPAEKHIGSELCSLYQYLLPVVAAICAMLMGMEKIALIQVIAMCVIVLGMILTNKGKKKRARNGASQ